MLSPEKSLAAAFASSAGSPPEGGRELPAPPEFAAGSFALGLQLGAGSETQVSHLGVG